MNATMIELSDDVLDAVRGAGTVPPAVIDGMNWVADELPPEMALAASAIREGAMLMGGV